jgi:hypothetical protein
MEVLAYFHFWLKGAMHADVHTTPQRSTRNNVKFQSIAEAVGLIF